jgi:HSF-type DNA-binding
MGSPSASLPTQSNGLSQSTLAANSSQDQPVSSTDPFRGPNSLMQLLQKQHEDEQRRILLSQQLAALGGDSMSVLRNTDADQQNTATLLLLLHQQQQQLQQQQQQQQLQFQQQQRLQQLRALVQLHEANSISSSMTGTMYGGGSIESGARDVNAIDVSNKSRHSEAEMQEIPKTLSAVDEKKRESGVDPITHESSLKLDTTQNQTIGHKSKGKGRTGKFPQKLHQMLLFLEMEAGGSDIASFLPDGWAFAIHKPRDFAHLIMPKYFRMSRFSSFQRQLNLYDFQRITTGKNKGAYYHQLFKRDSPDSCNMMKRNKIKGIRDTSHAAKAPKKGLVDDSDDGDDDSSME